MSLEIRPGTQPTLDVLRSFAQALCTAFGWNAALTSFCRTDSTAHGRCSALDLAFRSGPFAQQKSLRDVHYYRDESFVRQLMHLCRQLGPIYPEIRRVLIEVDHLHIDAGKRFTPHIRVGIYAPGKCHDFACEQRIGRKPIMLT